MSPVFNMDQVLVGQPAVVSDQGREGTCASHAVGKAVVDILDSMDDDCDQDKIIENLVEKVQPNRDGARITDYMDKQIDVVYWEKGLESTATQARITLKVQTQTGVTPSMSPQQLRYNK